MYHTDSTCHDGSSSAGDRPLVHKHSHHDLPIVLYATAEATDPRALESATGLTAVASARELSALSLRDFILVPVCTGRDLTSITQAAQAMHWLSKSGDRVLAISPPVVNATYAVARMRQQVRRAAGHAEAILFVSAAIDPFADAELFRRARLAMQFSEQLRMAVAFDDPANRGLDCWPSPQQAVADLSTLLGPGEAMERIAVVRADLHAVESQLDTEQAKALMTPTALLAAVKASAHTALHALDHGEDGISAALLADHGQGFAHSHGEEDHEHSHGHHHSHSHEHHHAHSHGHYHAHDHVHPHAPGASHMHLPTHNHPHPH